MIGEGRISVQRPINEWSQEGFILGFGNVTYPTRVYIVCKIERPIKHREEVLRWMVATDELGNKQ